MTLKEQVVKQNVVRFDTMVKHTLLHKHVCDVGIHQKRETHSMLFISDD